MNVLCGGSTPCPITLSSLCVYYTSSNLPYTGVTTNMSLQEALQAIDAKIGELEVTGGGGVWGGILGNILNQTDLITYISNNYLSLADAVFQIISEAIRPFVSFRFGVKIF